MSSNYNLDEQSSEYFEFTLNGFVYQMKYPTTEEIEKIELIKDEKKQAEWFYEFISSKDEKAPSIGDTLKKSNVSILRNFNIMLKAEFSLED